MGKLIADAFPVVISFGWLMVFYLKIRDFGGWLRDPGPFGISEFQGFGLVLFLVFALGIYFLAQH